MRPVFITFLTLLVLALALSFWPQADLAISGWFYDPALSTFPAREYDAFVPHALHELGTTGVRVLGAGFFLALCWTAAKRKALLGMGARAYAYLLTGLVLLPGVLANVVLKDNWGRARPVQITEFGGDAQFTLPWVMADQCARNCSFVAGDGAAGFFMLAFYFVVPEAYRLRAFWAGLLCGVVMGGNRIVMGAHFTSDVLWAGVLMIAGMVILSWVFNQGRGGLWQELRPPQA